VFHFSLARGACGGRLLFPDGGLGGVLCLIIGAAILAQPNAGYDKPTVDKISQSTQFLYNFLMVRYTDKDSIKNNKYCGRDGGNGSFNECGYHNSMKLAEE
jgi:hypothetical protein